MDWTQFSDIIKTTFPNEILDKLQGLEDLILRLNKKHNFISRDDEKIIRGRHTQDSLMALNFFPKNTQRVVDFGSGTGFPLLPLAIACPDIQFTGVEIRTKRVQIINYLIRTLGISNANCVAADISKWNPDFQPDIITARAVGSLKEDWNRIQHFIGNHSRFITFKGDSPESTPDNCYMDSKTYNLYPGSRDYQIICLGKSEL